jgi:hypothetical protein
MTSETHKQSPAPACLGGPLAVTGAAGHPDRRPSDDPAERAVRPAKAATRGSGARSLG